VLQEAALDSLLTVREAIDLYSAPYPSPRPAAEVAELVGLSDKLDARVNTVSGGQRRRLDLAVGIGGDPSWCSSTSRRPGSTPPPAASRGS